MPMSNTSRPFCRRSARILDEALRRMTTSLPDQVAEPRRDRPGLLGERPPSHAITWPMRLARVSGCGRRWVGWGRSLVAVRSVEESVLAWGETSLEVGAAEPT